MIELVTITKSKSEFFNPKPFYAEPNSSNLILFD